MTALPSTGEPAAAPLVTANLRQWPGRSRWRHPSSPEPVEPIGNRIMLTLFALPERDAVPERFGLAAHLVSLDGLVLDGGLVVEDDLELRDPDALAALRGWARAHPVKTATSDRPRRVITLTEFNRSVFARRAYSGQCLVASADLGRSLALLADFFTAASLDGWSDGFGLGLRGLGVVTTKRGRPEWVRSTGKPIVYVQGVSAHGTKVAFGKPRPSFDDDGHDSERRGVWLPGENGKLKHYRGRFAELLGASHALSGTDSSELDDHFRAWGLPALGTPYSVTLTPDGAAQVTAVVDQLLALTLLVAEEAGEWAGGLDLPRLHSPGSVAAELSARMRLVAPLGKFDLDDDELGHWMACVHGGLVMASKDTLGQVFDGADLDARSAFPAIAIMLGWWRQLTAARVELRDVTAELRELLARPDLAQLMRRRSTWRRFGLTRVVLRPQGEPLPVELPRPGGTSRLFVLGVEAERFDATWLDAVAASVLAGHAVEVVEAVKAVPLGRQSGLRPVEVLGVELDARNDPAVTLGQRRRAAKAVGDMRRADALRAVMNALVWGNPARFDPGGEAGEGPGPWCWPPLAATVAAGARCLMALAEAEVGPLAYVDTDGFIAEMGEDRQ